MEDRHPKGTLVTIEEEPRSLQRLQIANDMRLPCWRIALGTHDSNLLPLVSHIHHNQHTYNQQICFYYCFFLQLLRKSVTSSTNIHRILNTSKYRGISLSDRLLSVLHINNYHWIKLIEMRTLPKDIDKICVILFLLSILFCIFASDFSISYGEISKTLWVNFMHSLLFRV